MQPFSTRRDFLARSAFWGCSLAASPLVTPMTFAAAPWDTRLVVIILRGGMDGLDVVRPLGDPAYAALRPTLLSNDAPIDLDGPFALHPALAPLLPMWRRQELGFVHAVSTPYRDKRSHFDGQDLLEAGTDKLGGKIRDGWLNRMLQEVPGLSTQTAYAIGNNDVRVLDGAAPVANWAPDANLRLSPAALRLAQMVMEDDPAFHTALMEAEAIAESSEGEKTQGRAHNKIAQFAATRLREEARVAAFSLGGWDTHRTQQRSMARGLRRFSETLLTLQAGVGQTIWDKTAVIAMTEFGRTARENGTRGTDHGTAGLMILAGGAIRGGQVYGRWPGLGDGDLYQERDLMPTNDVRAPAAWIMRAMTGIDQTTLEDKIFPGLRMGSQMRLLR
ncbi:MAG: DUF1501 domain-containing protein [Sulfitobacter sp.]